MLVWTETVFIQKKKKKLKFGHIWNRSIWAERFQVAKWNLQWWIWMSTQMSMRFEPLPNRFIQYRLSLSLPVNAIFIIWSLCWFSHAGTNVFVINQPRLFFSEPKGGSNCNGRVGCNKYCKAYRVLSIHIVLLHNCSCCLMWDKISKLKFNKSSQHRTSKAIFTLQPSMLSAHCLSPKTPLCSISVFYGMMTVSHDL